MTRKWIPFAVVGGLVAIIAVMLVSRYNSLVSQREAVDGSWAQVQNVLQRRADLIPNLVETVKGYASHEKEVFEAVADARSKLAGARTPSEAGAANGQLDGALSRLLAISENYPQLKASEQFTRLQDELAGTENRISTERMRYNDAVREFNSSVKHFPNSMFGFSAKDYFQADAKAQSGPPQVKF
jgi:LemA protein